MIQTSLIAAIIATGANAVGWGAEPLTPQADFRMITQIQDQSSGMTMEAELRHSNGRFRMETQFQGQDAVVLIDPASTTVTILMSMSGMRLAMDVAADDSGFDIPVADDRLGEPVGTDIVAGEPCTLYRFETEDASGGEALGCLTDDYIVLRVSVPDEGAVFEAREFERAEQEDRWFVVPQGYQRMSMGAMGAFPR
ncbi:hypothetical protein F1654_05405 [Alkalicaulis satelles]|uniref:DUF4412 domain-containing protein n=1 Tax=Alkalicaulis satelles TaxID=2609175 RepID=A0A5M6ZKQ9_9PROT|nr:hypothetical protein [Alkalicaulis satelles]KAA5805416.1 hypothetical protein F1654_05405 [Alkalicaulis satelles]